MKALPRVEDLLAGGLGDELRDDFLFVLYMSLLSKLGIVRMFACPLVVHQRREPSQPSSVSCL
jgi:hypothetical protein